MIVSSGSLYRPGDPRPDCQSVADKRFNGEVSRRPRHQATGCGGPHGSTNAICDPEEPDEGDCEEFADGLTSIVDLAPADDDGIYALSLVNASWFAWEVLGVDPIGGVWLVEDEGEGPEAVDTGDPLILPGGIDVDRKDRVWVSGPIFGPGSVRTLP